MMQTIPHSLMCANHRARSALYLALYQNSEEVSRAVLCEWCAAKKAAFKSPHLTLRRLSQGKRSSSGLPLCTRCRRVATHEGSYYQSNKAPAFLFYCAVHAQERQAVPLAQLQAALWTLGENVVPRILQAHLAEVGVSISYELAQDALWVRRPDIFVGSQFGIYCDAEMARAETAQRQVPATFQAKMDGLLTGNL